MTAPSSSAYESWVLALREWATDPRRDLSGLPALQADSLPPSAYERLLGHISAAQQQVMDTWQRQLERGVAAARTEHDYGRMLVELRGPLARRLQLARHAGLPAQIRQALSEGVERDIRRLQQDLEDAVTQPGRSTVRSSAERLLRVVRSNGFTALLDPAFPLDALFGHAPPQPSAPAATPFAAVAATIETRSSGRVLRRRVILDDVASGLPSDQQN